MSQLNRSTNKDVVSEPTNEVEEAADIEAENCTTARNLPESFCQPAHTAAQLTPQLLPNPADDASTVLIAKSS